VRGALLGALLLSLLPLAALGGCGGDEEPEASRPSRRTARGGGLVGDGTRHAPGPVTTSAATGSTREDRDRDEDEAPSRLDRLAAEEAARPAPPEAPAEAEPAERNLSAELTSAFGSPTDCFDFARVSTLGDTLVVNVSITVMPSGRVNRSSVSASGLLPAEIDCLEQRAMTVALRAPIEDAPRTISSRIEYAIETRPAEAAPTE
jgi:hypothetical protein